MNDKYIPNPPMEEVLIHYGTNHLKGNPGSGRYPWGSGDSPYQHSGDFLSRVKELRKENKSFTDMRETIKDGKGNDIPNPDYGKTFTGETAVAKMLGLDTTEYRNAVTLAKNLERMSKVNRAEALYSQGYGYSEIGRKMGISESSVRGLLDPNAKKNMMMAQNTADFLKERLNELSKNDPNAMIDIGPGVENEITEDDIGFGLETSRDDLARDMGISRKKFDDAIYILEGEGYVTGGSRLQNVTDPTGMNKTTMNVLGLPGMQKKNAYNFNSIYSVKDYISRDNGETYEKRFEYPESMDSSRLMIRYDEEGGKALDGVIELRRGVPDLSLGESNYAQVRILVDDDHYMKGMAVYADDLPDGIDVRFNTNKKVGTPVTDVLKPVKKDKTTGEIDRDNPFGSLIKDKDKGGQYWYDSKTGERLESKADSPNAKLGLINKRSDEGDWNDWQDTLSSQFLSKQNTSLAKRQLDLAVKDKQQEFNEIMALNNNTVKKIYLEQFANDCDSDAIHLKAAALPRQKFQVILPVTSLKDDEIYAPNYNNGDKLALVRYPHGGTFEIPIVTVNNNNKEGEFRIGPNSKDCVGINSKVAERLSGADFDGDTVMVVPLSEKINITSTPQLRGLREPDGSTFDPKTKYGPAKTVRKEDSPDGKDHYYNAQGVEYKIMKATNLEMGKVSNLITDMTIKGATNDELARAVRHSMVVIDAAKHNLDYEASYVQNDIESLKKKYQKHYDAEGNLTNKYGASTLISQAKSEERITQTQGQPKINIKGTPQYDPNRPEGALIYKVSDKAEYKQIKDPVTKKNADVYERKDGSLYYLRGPKGDRTVIDITDPADIAKIKSKVRMQKSTKMAQTDDARTLISDKQSQIEKVYAAYANTCKSLANEARKALYNTKGVEYSPSAAKTYKKEVEELDIALDKALKNKPRERQAQIFANSRINSKFQSNPGLDKEDKKKIRQQEITRARDMFGAKRELIDITPRQWEAIQAGAIHASKLEKILQRADMDKVRQLATPREYTQITPAKEQRIRSYANAGKTNSEIAAALGISVSSVQKCLSGE